MRPEQQLVSIHRRRPASLLAAQDRSEQPNPTRKTPLVTSASELRDFLRCRVKHHWRHQCRLEPIEKPNALAIGILVHEILEEWYANLRRTPTLMKDIAADRLRETTFTELKIEDKELIGSMCIGYAFWAKEADREIGLEFCEPEKWFEFPLVEGDRSMLVRGKIDNVFYPRKFKRTVACQETKTKGQIRVDTVDMNIQLSVYLWALRQMYPSMKRYIAYYTILRKQMPGPRVKADLFHREHVERTDDEIDQWAVDTRRAALDMLDGAIYPNPMDSCSWDCDFTNPCMLRGRPDDLTHVLTTMYKEKERR